jgi:hypothetical protein
MSDELAGRPPGIERRLRSDRRQGGERRQADRRVLIQWVHDDARLGRDRRLRERRARLPRRQGNGFLTLPSA